MMIKLVAMTIDTSLQVLMDALNLAISYRQRYNGFLVFDRTEAQVNTSETYRQKLDFIITSLQERINSHLGLSPMQSNNQEHQSQSMDQQSIISDQPPHPLPSSQSDCHHMPFKLVKTIFSARLSDNGYNWMSYWKDFEPMIHLNPLISDPEKVHLLRSTIGTCPLNDIQHLSQNSIDYSKAINILTRKYNRSDLIESNILDSIYKLNYFRSANDLNSHSTLISALESALNQFHLLDNQSIERDIIKYVHKLLPSLIKDKLAEARVTSVAQLRNFFSIRYEDLLSQQKFNDGKPTTSDQGFNRRIPPNRKETDLYRSKRTNNFHVSSQHQQQTSSLQNSSRWNNTKLNNQQSCRLCLDQGHFGFNCIKHDTPEKKRLVVERYNLCSICFMNNHLASRCNKREFLCCKHCKSDHHTSMCITSTKRPIEIDSEKQKQDTPRGKRIKVSTSSQPS